MTEIRDCLARKIGELDEPTGFFSSRFGTDGYEGYVPIGKSVASRHGKSKTFIHRVAETQYEFTSSGAKRFMSFEFFPDIIPSLSNTKQPVSLENSNYRARLTS